MCIRDSSSRSLKDEEKAKGLEETTLALDGIALVVNPENPVSDLDLETISKIYTGEISNWKDVGGNDSDIVLIGREAGSGTRDGFESITYTTDKCQYRQELTSTGDVIATVASNPNAIGYASLSAVKDSVKALKDVYKRQIHDMFPITHAKDVGRIYGIYFKHFMKSTIANADYIIYNSRETKKQTYRFYPERCV